MKKNLFAPIMRLCGLPLILISLINFCLILGKAGAELVLYLPFNEGSGIKVADNSGQGNSGTAIEPIWTEGISGSALSFEGGEWVEVPSSDDLDKAKRSKAVELVERLETEDRLGVAQELVKLGDPSVIPAIKKYLNSEDRRTRCSAGFVLAGLGDEKGLSAIVAELKDINPRPTKRIRSDGKPDIKGQIRSDRYFAALVLGLIGDKRAVPSLIEATKDKTIHYQAAISLGKIGDKGAISALRQMAKDFPEDRLWAGYGLAALGEQQGFDILTEVSLSDSSWTDRRHAVRALGTIGDSGAVPTLIRVLNEDRHANVRVAAARALGKIGAPSAIPALTESLKDVEPTKVNAPTTVSETAADSIKVIKAQRAADVRRGKEGKTKDNLDALRSAVIIYYGDKGVFPATLANLTPKYIKEIPTVDVGIESYLKSKKVKVGKEPDNTGGWLYNPKSGMLWVNCTHSDIQGKRICDW